MGYQSTKGPQVQPRGIQMNRTSPSFEKISPKMKNFVAIGKWAGMQAT